MIILKWKCDLNSCDSGYGTMAGYREPGNETSGSIKEGELLE
jgi:hypothetical protein